MNHNTAQRLAEKLTRELFRIAQAYGKTYPFSFENLRHDLDVMLKHDALHRLSLKFYRPNSSRDVLAEYNYAIHNGNIRFHLDDAQGLGIVPLKPPFDMGLVVNRDTQNNAYAQHLQLSWSNAPRYARYNGFQHQDGNTTHRTGGHASKQIYMDHTLRRLGKIKFFLPGKGYGFIDNSGGDNIFFHHNNVQGFEPCKGQRVTYLPLVTPRGMQAKDVRLA